MSTLEEAAVKYIDEQKAKDMTADLLSQEEIVNVVESVFTERVILRQHVTSLQARGTQLIDDSRAARRLLQKVLDAFDMAQGASMAVDMAHVRAFLKTTP